MRAQSLLTAIIVGCIACERPVDSPDARFPRLPSGNAGKIVERAIDAAGGWERWRAIRDVAFVATFALYDPIGNMTSQTIGLHKSKLHGGPQVRFESLGMPVVVVVGFDGVDTWMIRDGHAIPNPGDMTLPRFNVVSNLFWFLLPFSLAEMPATVTDMGEQSEGSKQWQRLKVTLESGAPEAPGDWFVFYFDQETGLIDRVLVHTTAQFLNHSTWVGKWLDYQDWNGIRKERRRQFFPADPVGTIVGNVIVEHLVEDVRFDNQFPAELFEKPLAVHGGSPA